MKIYLKTKILCDLFLTILEKLVMQILNYKPKNLYLIDKNEHQLFN